VVYATSFGKGGGAGQKVGGQLGAGSCESTRSKIIFEDLGARLTGKFRILEALR